MPETKPSSRRFLLNGGDYIVIRSEETKYLFLSKTLQYFKITNPSIDEYLRLCETDGYGTTNLTKDEIKSIGNYLTANNDTDVALPPDAGHNFLILNLTGGCNLACKYCFAEITQKHNTMTLDIAKKAICNMLNQKKEIEEYSIFYFGGEPLMKKDLLKQITEYAYKEVAKRKDKVSHQHKRNID